MSKKIDPAVKWLSQLVAPMSPTDFLIRQAQDLLVKSGQFRPPFNSRKAIPSTVKRIEIVQISRDGMLIPVEGGFIIKLNADKPKVRQNFACAHEIGHTFFFDSSGKWPWRPYESMSYYWVEEDLCYQFAEEMLMPRFWMEKLVEGHFPSIENFYKLLKSFQVSAEALIRRIARLDLWQCIFVILVKDDKSPNMLKRKLVMKHSKYKYLQIKWDRLLSPANIPFVAYMDPGSLKRLTVRGNDLIRRGKQDENWSIESIRLSGTVLSPVITIITPYSNIN